MKINFPFNFQLRVYFSRLEKREGACSKIFGQEDKHIVLWDFDNSELSKIIESLNLIQLWYKLPKIYIVSSSKNRYHAYCFTARTLREVITIISATPEIDTKYLRLGMVRGYYTLRITSRKHDDFKLVETIPSFIPDEVNPLDITIDEYMTINKGDNNA